jgi:hypothetical protein
MLTASQSRVFSVFDDGSLLEDVQYFRQPHDVEVLIPGPSAKSPDRNYQGNADGYGRDTGGKRAIPEPYRLLPDHQTPLNCEFQKLIRDCNPEHKPDVVDNILDQAWILANNTGIGAPGRKNCRTGAVGDKWPALHAPIICGGALLRPLSIVDGYVYVESILTSNPVPCASLVLACPWLWFWLVEVNAHGQVTFMTLSALDGTRKPVRMPLLSRYTLYAKASWLHKLPMGFIPPSALWLPSYTA